MPYLLDFVHVFNFDQKLNYEIWTNLNVLCKLYCVYVRVYNLFNRLMVKMKWFVFCTESLKYFNIIHISAFQLDMFISFRTNSRTFNNFFPLLQTCLPVDVCLGTVSELLPESIYLFCFVSELFSIPQLMFK